MNATQRGISDHELIYLIETAYAWFRSLGITGRVADRAMVGMVTRACEFLPKEAIEAAYRLVPTTKGGDDGDRD